MYIADIQIVTFYANCATLLQRIIVIFVSDMKTFLKILTLFISVGAVGGAVMMWMDPTGVSWGGEPMLDLLRAKMPWPDVLFRNFIPSGLVLLTVNGLTQLLAAMMNLWKSTLKAAIFLLNSLKRQSVRGQSAVPSFPL